MTREDGGAVKVMIEEGNSQVTSMVDGGHEK